MKKTNEDTREITGTELATRLCCHAVRDLKEKLGEARLNGPFLRDWTEGLHPQLREETLRYVRATRLKLHDAIDAVCSSMAFRFNLFMPFRVAGQGALADLLGRAVGRRLVVDDVDFEVRAARDVLGEWSRDGAPGSRDKVTTSDIGVAVRDESGRRGRILMEVKCSEGGFNPCAGCSSRSNRSKVVCASALRVFTMPGECHLTRPRRAGRERRYWEIFQRQHGSLLVAFPHADLNGPCPFAGDNQQPMRKHALALGLVQTAECDFAALGLVHHDGNRDVVPLWRAYRKLVAAPGLLFTLRASHLVALRGDAPWWADWQAYMRRRYGLAPAGAPTSPSEDAIPTSPGIPQEL